MEIVPLPMQFTGVKALWFTAQQGVGTIKCWVPKLHACSSRANSYTNVTVMLKANASTAVRATGKANKDGGGGSMLEEGS